jgi:hypothetical protein
MTPSRPYTRRAWRAAVTHGPDGASRARIFMPRQAAPLPPLRGRGRPVSSRSSTSTAGAAWRSRPLIHHPLTTRAGSAWGSHRVPVRHHEVERYEPVSARLVSEFTAPVPLFPGRTSRPGGPGPLRSALAERPGHSGDLTPGSTRPQRPERVKQQCAHCRRSAIS